MKPKTGEGFGLVLTRKIGEVILVKTPSGDFTITITGVMGSRARMAFNCPPNIRVFRKEAYERGTDPNDNAGNR